MINCYAIVEKCNLNALANHVIEYPSTRLVGYYEGKSLKYSEIIGLSVQVVFVDYSLHTVFSHLLTILESHVSVVYLANSPDAAYQAFEHGALDYITYPFNFARFEKCMNKFVRFSLLAPAVQQQGEKIGTVDSFFIKPDPRGKVELLINYSDVLFIEAFQNDVAIQMADGRRFVCFHTMKEMEEGLSAYFMRVHKSFIINYKRIAAFDGSNIIIGTDQQFTIPLGGVYKKSFFDKRNTIIIKKPNKRAQGQLLKIALKIFLVFLSEEGTLLGEISAF